MVWHRTDQIPVRDGPHPSTTILPPHAQIDQLSDRSIADHLLGRLSKLETVCFRQSRLARPSALALALPDAVAHGPKDAFLDDHEFCHFHHTGGGYLHMTLPPAAAAEIRLKGWGEIHLLAKAGAVSPTIHFIYAPRTLEEVEVVLFLVHTSMNYAKGAAAHGELGNHDFRH